MDILVFLVQMVAICFIILNLFFTDKREPHKALIFADLTAILYIVLFIILKLIIFKYQVGI